MKQSDNLKLNCIKINKKFFRDLNCGFGRSWKKKI